MTTERNTLIQDSEEKFKKLNDIKNRHLNCFAEYETIINSSDCKAMGKNSPIYGMFISDNNLIKYFWEKGACLTNNAEQRDSVYYFDGSGRLLLSEMYNGNGGNRVLRWYFFYYHEDHTEIIKYSPEDSMIRTVASIDYKNGELDAFLESGDLGRGMVSYVEYLFNSKPDCVIKKVYGRYIESIVELARLH